MEIDIESPDLARAIEKFGGMSVAIEAKGRQFIIAGIGVLKASIEANAPVRTGTLRSSVTAVASGMTGRVGVDGEGKRYAGYVEKGTPAHYITAKNAQALYWRGAQHPVYTVNHPGTKANPFFTRGVTEATPEVLALAEGMIEEIVMEFKI